MGTTTGHHLASLLICVICATIYLGTDFTTAIAKKQLLNTYNKETLWVNCTSESDDEEKQLSVQEFYNKKNKCYHSMNHKAVFFHVGKAGGGTIRRELLLNKIGGIPIKHSRKSISGGIKALQSGKSQTLIINVRDPVDRFVRYVIRVSYIKLKLIAYYFSCLQLTVHSNGD